MVKIANLDDSISIIDQLGEDDSPVVLVNIFTVDQGEADSLIEAWTRDAEFMKRQRGFISTQLHRGIGNSSAFLNYAVWESVAAFKTAFGSPEFQRQVAAYPPSAVVRPHLFRKISVPGICIAA
jgi:heme-degrading monooxygenase HmoA